MHPIINYEFIHRFIQAVAAEEFSGICDCNVTRPDITPNREIKIKLDVACPKPRLIINAPIELFIRDDFEISAKQALRKAIQKAL